MKAFRFHLFCVLFVSLVSGTLVGCGGGRPSLAALPNLMATLKHYDRAAQTPIYIVGFGSSVGLGATTPNPNADAPVAYFATALKAALDASGRYDWKTSNQSVNGTIAYQFPDAWAEMKAKGITPAVCVFAYGMNDGEPAQFNAGETFPWFSAAMLYAANVCKQVGADVVILTSPQPSVINYSGAFVDLPSFLAQIYPTPMPAPVTLEQTDAAGQLGLLTGDYAANGLGNITVSQRYLQVNQAMRNIAVETHVVLVDPEKFGFDAMQTEIASTGSQSAAENKLFNAGECVHPNLLYHQLSYHAAIDAFMATATRNSL